MDQLNQSLYLSIEERELQRSSRALRKIAGFGRLQDGWLYGDGAAYVISGGAGAPLSPEESRPAFHHYVRVAVQGASFETEVVRVEVQETVRWSV